MSDTCAHGVTMNVDGVREDRDEVDEQQREIVFAWRIVTRRPGRDHPCRQTRNSMQRSVRSHAVWRHFVVDGEQQRGQDVLTESILGRADTFLNARKGELSCCPGALRC